MGCGMKRVSANPNVHHSCLSARFCTGTIRYGQGSRLIEPKRDLGSPSSRVAIHNTCTQTAPYTVIEFNAPPHSSSSPPAPTCCGAAAAAPPPRPVPVWSSGGGSELGGGIHPCVSDKNTHHHIFRTRAFLSHTSAPSASKSTRILRRSIESIDRSSCAHKGRQTVPTRSRPPCRHPSLRSN